MHSHILPSIRISLYTHKALAGDALSDFLFIPTSLFFRLHLGIIVYAGHILAPFKREEIRKEMFCLAR